ncbi:MAG: hypothetical protein J7L38_00360 [Thermoproteales archaeon]|nr:hypothetical protein [Thermoproteales archaeon]
MRETLENLLWIVAGVIIAVIVIVVFMGYAQSGAQRADFIVYDIQAYSDGTVYFTVKNTGTVPITGITIDGVSASATGITSLKGGQEAQYQASGLSLTAGEYHEFTIVATFSNGQEKTIRQKVIVKS